MEKPQPFVGIDVSSKLLDVDTLPASHPFSKPNTEDGIASLVSRLKALNPKIVLLEATGGYEIPVAYALYEAGLPVVIMNPKNLRHFAKAIGRLAKTDKLDAQVLALYAQMVQPPVQPLRDQEQLELANLMTRRRQLQAMIVMEENRRRTCTPKVRGNIDQHLVYLRQLLKDLDREIHDAIRGQKDAFLKTTSGLRALVAARKRARRPGPVITINCVISKASLATLDKMVPLARELGADILQIQHTIFNSPANVRLHNRALSPVFAAEQGFYFGHELADILKGTVDRGKAHIGDFVKFMQFLHNPLADL